MATRAQRFEDIKQKVAEARDDAQELADEIRMQIDVLPENMTNKQSMLEDAESELDDFIGELRSLDDYQISFTL